MTAFDRNVFVKMLLSVPQKDDAALFPKSERSPYIQKLLEAFDKEETIDLSIIDWDAFQIENVTPENYERVYHRVFDQKRCGHEEIQRRICVWGGSLWL